MDLQGYFKANKKKYHIGNVLHLSCFCSNSRYSCLLSYIAQRSWHIIISETNDIYRCGSIRDRTASCWLYLIHCACITLFVNRCSYRLIKGCWPLNVYIQFKFCSLSHFYCFQVATLQGYLDYEFIKEITCYCFIFTGFSMN